MNVLSLFFKQIPKSQNRADFHLGIEVSKNLVSSKTSIENYPDSGLIGDNKK